MLRKTGFILAGMACTLLASGVVSANPEKNKHKGMIKCQGPNACKGKSDCGSKNSNACKGQNACKHKGWVFMKTSEECHKAGGKVMEEKAN